MIDSKHEPGSNAWYDDLEADLRRKGIEISDGTIEIERFRLMEENKVHFPPDNRRIERLMRESGDLAEGQTYQQWVEEHRPEFERLFPDLVEKKAAE